MKMKISSAMLKIPVLLIFITIFAGCSSSLKVSTGSSDNKPLVFNNEYETKHLKEVNVEGASFWGIPSFTKNNLKKNERGFLFTFNGVHLGRTPRIFPILTLLGYTFTTGALITAAGGRKYETRYYNYGGLNSINIQEGNRIPLGLSMILALPLAGALNNFSWQGSSMSGASQMMNNILLTENPDVDVFFYPKYETNNQLSFWSQKATIKAKVSGAILKRTIK